MAIWHSLVVLHHHAHRTLGTCDFLYFQNVVSSSYEIHFQCYLYPRKALDEIYNFPLDLNNKFLIYKNYIFDRLRLLDIVVENITPTYRLCCRCSLY